MKYPWICSHLVYTPTQNHDIMVRNTLTDDVFIVSRKTAKFMRRLNGRTAPQKISCGLNESEKNNLLEELDENELLRDKRFFSMNGSLMFTLWTPKNTIFFNFLSQICNSILLVSWLPVLLLGIYCFLHTSFEGDSTYVGYFVGTALGLIFHELGHAFATVHYKGHFFEMGLLLFCYVIPGAYVLTDAEPIEKRLHRIQMYAAGVESNFLLAGIAMILFYLSSNIFFFEFAFANIFLGVVNLSIFPFIDGFAIASELLQSGNLIFTFFSLLYTDMVSKVLKKGVVGGVALGVYLVIALLSLGLPITIIINIWEVIMLCLP